MHLMICSFVVCFLLVSAQSYKDALCPNCQGGTCCGNGCCPLASAVCCSGGLTCCPSGTSCGPDKKCYGSAVDSQLFLKYSPQDKSCPNCQGGTCCGEGCCPFASAVCCSGGLTCCPSGTSCGPNKKCYGQHGDTQPSFKSTAPVKSKNETKVSISSEIGSVTCPDGGSCADGNTCCPNSAGGYGCCPQVDATCCSDGKHCCPSGYTCGNPGDNHCYASGDTADLLMMTSVKANSKISEIGSVTCPDGGSCADGNTCCPNSAGGYGCCPQVDATCCSDGNHCCPSGYTCGNPGDNHCYASGDTADLLMMTSVKANSKISEIGSVTCPDGGSCADGNTCCPNSAGGYGCCPQVDATCCSDGQHCCPSGYTCGGDKCYPSKRIHPIMTLV